jgi:Holliday junction resolvase RusA-like endonuclease
VDKNILNITIDNDVLERYNKYYFRKYPKRKKVPIERPMHPSINTWMILQRPAMNNLKQVWKEFIQWLIKDLGYQDMKLDKYEMTFTTYMPTKRRSDPDNMSPKFIMDGFTEAGFIIDDDGLHLKALTLKTDYDKEHPRTEICVNVLND